MGNGRYVGQRSDRMRANTLRETVRGTTAGTWDNGYAHAWTQLRAALRPRGRVHCKAPRI
eukprot:4051773-Prymnesium_polylepis.1